MSRAEAIRRYYATERNLRIHEDTQSKYSVPNIDFVRWTLDTIGWAGDEVVLDIGPGRGNHYACLLQQQPALAYYALDLSPNLLLNHPCASDRLALGDAMRLPYSDDSFDIVMANHVLYHLADIEAGLAEIKRVLKPDGRLLAATDSQQNLIQLQMLIHRANVFLSDNGATVKPPAQPCEAFALENGTRILARHFYAVVRHDLPCQLVFDDIEPALQYLDSMRDLRQDSLPDDVSWDDMMIYMRQFMTQLMGASGKLEIDLITGALVASDCGGFIHDFITRDQAGAE
ncbi:MAG: methyltransferase domain-containing protein [Chloroflexi bacterium]|nr:methyltransferase domain-containing protein [Chloroflexota bacterium]